MKKLEIYNNEAKNEKGNYTSYFYGIISYNEDESKNCSGFYQDGSNLMTVCSDLGARGESILRIFDYGSVLSSKIFFEFNDVNNYFNYMTELINKCAFLDPKEIKSTLSKVGNVSPEYSVEKFNDPSNVFSEIENGKTLREIVGQGRNFSHDYTAYEQTPTFSNKKR